MDAFKNLAYSMVVVPPTPPNLGTSIMVPTGHSARFPAPPFNVTVWPKGLAPDVANAEIVRVVGVTGELWTIQRQQEGSYARAIEVDDQVAQALTLRSINDLKADAQTAAQTWVNGRGYATETWVAGQAFATQAWVTSQTFATQSWVTGRGYRTIADSYTKAEVESRIDTRVNDWVAALGLTSAALDAKYLQISPRTVHQGSSASIQPNVNTTDFYRVWGLTSGLTISNPAGTARENQQLIIQVYTTTASQPLAWGNAYVSWNAYAPLPSAITIGVWTFGFRYSTATAQWVLYALTRQV